MQADELGRIWKEAVVAYSKYYPDICLKELRQRSNSSERTSGVQTEIRIEVERHSTTGQLGVKSEMENVLFRIYLLVPGTEL